MAKDRTIDHFFVSRGTVVVCRYLFRRDGSTEGRNEWSVSPRQGFKAAKRAWTGDLSILDLKLALCSIF